jgi:hypothetical protein
MEPASRKHEIGTGTSDTVLLSQLPRPRVSIVPRLSCLKKANKEVGVEVHFPERGLIHGPPARL